MPTEMRLRAGLLDCALHDGKRVVMVRFDMVSGWSTQGSLDHHWTAQSSSCASRATSAATADVAAAALPPSANVSSSRGLRKDRVFVELLTSCKQASQAVQADCNIMQDGAGWCSRSTAAHTLVPHRKPASLKSGPSGVAT